MLGLLILVSCSKRDQEEGSWSHFLGLVDTVTVRDTILKVDTLIVDREVILRDTVLGQVLFLVEIIEAGGFNQQQARLASPYRVSSPFEARA